MPNKHNIPNIIHFIHLKGRPFNLINYLAVRSAFDVNTPEKIYMHCDVEPEGEYWQKAKEYFEIRFIDPPINIFGLNIKHPAHQSDIARILILQKEGGIYLDTDTLSNRKLIDLTTNLLGLEQVIMGEEYLEGKKIGLCNAVVIAEAGAQFLERWLDGFDPSKSLWKGFRSESTLGTIDRYYSEISIKYSHFLSNYYPEEIKVVDKNHFFYPSHAEDELKNFFLGNGGGYEECYVFHTWASIGWENYLKNISEEDIKTKDTNFNVLARKFLD